MLLLYSFTDQEEVALCWAEAGAGCMAHNGWVMGDDPLRNFALPGSSVYLRRELVAWGDSVKLRYGDQPGDSPWLWEHMGRYVDSVVDIFDGVRLDNCHSTPLHVASWLLDRARRARPDLYVCAELFTGSEEKDHVFVNTLGITSLIREGMAAWDSHELGRMVYKYGGSTLGALASPPGAAPELRPDTAHALFYDWTHDNPSPVERRSVEDMLPSAGLVAMAACGVASSRGYDELVPHHIHVVAEQRPYCGWSQLGGGTEAAMVEARRELSALHTRLAGEGFSEVFVDQKNRDVVAVTRHCPQTRRSVIMVAHTHFFPGNTLASSGLEVLVEGRLHAVLLEAKMVNIGDADSEDKHAQFQRDPDHINGLDNWKAVVSRGGQGGLVRVISDGSEEDTGVRLNLDNLPIGSFVVFEVWPQHSHSESIEALSHLDTGALGEAVTDLSLLDVQFVLFQCGQEGGGCYNVPGHGDLHYCGLAGLVPLLARLRRHNDLGHPLAANLRAGDWLLDFTTARLDSLPAAARLAAWLRARVLAAALSAALSHPALLRHGRDDGVQRRAGAQLQPHVALYPRRLGAGAAARPGLHHPHGGVPQRAAAPALPRALAASHLAHHRRRAAALLHGLHALLGPRHLHLAARAAARHREVRRGAGHPARVRGHAAPRPHPQPAGRRPQRALQLPGRGLVVAPGRAGLRGHGGGRRQADADARGESLVTVGSDPIYLFLGLLAPKHLTAEPPFHPPPQRRCSV